MANPTYLHQKEWWGRCQLQEGISVIVKTVRRGRYPVWLGIWNDGEWQKGVWRRLVEQCQEAHKVSACSKRTHSLRYMLNEVEGTMTQLANQGSPGKMASKKVCVCYSFTVFRSSWYHTLSHEYKVKQSLSNDQDKSLGSTIY